MSMPHAPAPSRRALASVPPEWQTALRCRRRGVSAVQAVRRVFAAMESPAHPATVAVVMAGAYASEWWSGDRMDHARLAAALHESGNWNQGSCRLAAAAAVSPWKGLHLRSSATDAGLVPPQGCTTESPDLLCSPDGPLSPALVLARGWRRRFFHAQPLRPNALQVRAASLNLPAAVRGATARVWQAPAALNQPPGAWRPLRTLDGALEAPLAGARGGGAIPPDGRAATRSAFAYVPPDDGNASLLAVVSTELFSALPPEQPGNWSRQLWLKSNRAAAQRSIGTLWGSVASLPVHNQDDTAETFTFKAFLSRVPLGTRAVLEVVMPDGQEGTAKEKEVKETFSPIRTEPVTIAPRGAAELRLTLETPGGAPLPPGASIEMRQLWVIGAGHPRHAELSARTPPPPDDGQAYAVEVYLGSYTFVGPDR